MIVEKGVHLYMEEKTKNNLFKKIKKEGKYRKIYGDLFESIVGAIFIDTYLDIEKTSEIITNFYKD